MRKIEMKRKDQKPKEHTEKMARSEIVTIRLDPKLKYMAELCARKHRRTLSSFIEWAVNDSINKEIIHPSPNMNDCTFFDASHYLWCLDKNERLTRLAERFPYLLTYSEEMKLKETAGKK